jgi:acetyltransferase-like isoleucine patch superfamily enzyme
MTIIYYKHCFKKIGTNTVIYPVNRLFNPFNVTIGNGVVIEKEATFYAVKNFAGKKYDGKITIGNNVYINYGFNATAANYIEIQDDVLIAYNVSLFDFDHGYEDISKNINQTDLVVKGKIVIGEKSWLGMNVSILGNVTIGKHCVIAANSVVTRDIPDYSVVVGNPSKIIKQYNASTGKWEKVI